MFVLGAYEKKSPPKDRLFSSFVRQLLRVAFIHKFVDTYQGPESNEATFDPVS